MSIETWQEEFYPVPAENATGSELEAAQHSLRKWRGRSKEALQKHELLGKGTYLNDPDLGCDFVFDSDSCALCQYAADNVELISEEAVLTAHPGDDPHDLLEFEDCLKCPFTREFKRSCSAEYHATRDDAGHSMVGALDKLVTILKAKEGK